MDPVDLIIASLDVKGVFRNTPSLLLEAVWKHMGLLFYNFASDYIHTRKYTVRTGAGPTPLLEPGSGVPQGAAEGPFLYLLGTLPLVLTIEQDYPAYAPYPLLSPLVGFADNTNLMVAHTPPTPKIPPSLPSCNHTWPISPDMRPQPPRPSPYPTRAWYTASMVVLNASVGFQAAHLTQPITALQPAARAVTKALGAQGGWPTPMATGAIGVAWPHYGDAIGDEVKAAYTWQTALLLHRMTHNHSPEVPEVATIRLQAAQRARNTCPHCILHQTGMPTNINTRLWNHLQLLLPSPHHAILSNHTFPEKEPLAVLFGDLHHHPKGTIDTISLVGASITVVYVTLPPMRVLHRSRAHHTPFLQLPEWPEYHLFRQYLTQTARAAGHTLAGTQDMKTAYRDFKKQHACPVPATPP